MSRSFGNLLFEVVGQSAQFCAQHPPPGHKHRRCAGSLARPHLCMRAVILPLRLRKHPKNANDFFGFFSATRQGFEFRAEEWNGAISGLSKIRDPRNPAHNEILYVNTHNSTYVYNIHM